MLARWFEHSQVYRPRRTLRTTGREAGHPFEDVFFRAEDGVELNAWYFPPAGHSPHARKAVIFCHGNAGNMGDRIGILSALLEVGAAVLAFDYRGFGRSGGRPDEEGTYRDAQAAHRWLREKGFRGADLMVYGESLGGGVASELCAREETGGLILQSTFTSVTHLGAERFPWLPVRWMNRIKYDTIGKLPRIGVPVLIMHARNDSVIGFHHGQKNFAAANEPKLFWEIEGPHGNPVQNRTQFLEGMSKFMEMVRQRSPG